MNIEKAIFINRAPFEQLELDFKEKGINVLSGINGKGKTTILSYIVDAFHEMARPHFSRTYTNEKETSFYRISSSSYTMKSYPFSLIYFRFSHDSEIVDYIDCRGELTNVNYDKFIKLENKIPFSEIDDSIKNDYYAKKLSTNLNKKLAYSIFNNCLMTYFPAYRYEQPGYLTNPYKINLKFNTTDKFNGELTNRIEVISGIDDICNWVMDIVLDMEVNKRIEQVVDIDKSIKNINTTPELGLFSNLNNIISAILSSKTSGRSRFGIGRRGSFGKRVSIVQDRDKDRIVTVVPNLSDLSSGESTLLCLFGEILKQGDNISNNSPLDNIHGIVIVDEIDKHLHIKLQKEILPQLLKLFPNIQFIVSSHSPFLNMGLADNSIDRTRIFDLDNNGISCTPINNELYKEVYEMMISENNRFAQMYYDIENKITDSFKPIIITEGKTDWKHVKAALTFFNNKNEYTDINVQILEYDFDFGDSKLNSLLTNYSTFPPKYKIIGLFDCDEANGRDISSKHDGVKKYGTNVYGISIIVPQFRTYNKGGISIEFLYNDVDIKRYDENERRLYITSEFNEYGRLKEDNKIGVKNYNDVRKYTSNECEKIQASDVIDLEGNSLALSKESFANNILNKNQHFEKICFDSFRPIFEKIREILNIGEN